MYHFTKLITLLAVVLLGINISNITPVFPEHANKILICSDCEDFLPKS